MNTISDDEFPVSSYKPAFDKAIGNKDIELANTVAMLATEHFFTVKPSDAQTARRLLWENFFQPLYKGFKVQYQSGDFESVDYQLYRVFPGLPLLRGPRPELSKLVKGQYVTLFGAAQLFGRHQQISPHSVFERKLDVAGVNLANGGAGPEGYLRKKFVEVANGGQALVLQVLSGRSIGCDEFPGGRLTYGKKDIDKEKKINRIKLLGRKWRKSKREAIRLVMKWQENYVQAFEQLLKDIEVPVILAWISDRTPDAWSIEAMEQKQVFGRFPHLVDRKMLTSMAAHCAAVVEISEDSGLPHGFVNRFTGEKCPCFKPNGALVWENNYYLSKTASAETAKKISDALESEGIGR